MSRRRVHRQARGAVARRFNVRISRIAVRNCVGRGRCGDGVRVKTYGESSIRVDRRGSGYVVDGDGDARGGGRIHGARCNRTGERDRGVSIINRRGRGQIRERRLGLADGVGLGAGTAGVVGVSQEGIAGRAAGVCDADRRVNATVDRERGQIQTADSCHTDCGRMRVAIIGEGCSARHGDHGHGTGLSDSNALSIKTAEMVRVADIGRGCRAAVRCRHVRAVAAVDDRDSLAETAHAGHCRRGGERSPAVNVRTGFECHCGR